MNISGTFKSRLPSARRNVSTRLAAALAGTLLGLQTAAAAERPATQPLQHPESAQHDPDAALVKSLLRENLNTRSFDFATVAEACSGKRVLPLDDTPTHRRILAAIENALAETIRELNLPESPVKKLRRINEASRFFEQGLRARLDAIPGLDCVTPPTRAGGRQLSGYPDLRLTDRETGAVFYLDPKLVEQNSLNSTLRTFYFEPKEETLKITDDAVHLLIGIEHDGKDGAWTFGGWRLVDLSKLKVRLKAEFQASNADLYRKSALPHPAESP
ncbi:MAG: hypothetical protein ACO3JG_02355 [Luteolibacter sp.]